jgi:hypothetical protein
MNHSQHKTFNFLYEQHLTNLRLQGKRPAAIDAYSRAVRRISAYSFSTAIRLTSNEMGRLLS